MVDGANEAGERSNAEVDALLEQHGVPATAREFKLRQEFYRHRWDMRVREESGDWLVIAAKADRPRVEERGTSEREALRLALATALRHDAAVS